MKSILVKSVPIFLIVIGVFLYTNTEVQDNYVIEESEEYSYWSNLVETNGSKEGYEIFKDFFNEKYLVRHNMSHIIGDIIYENEGVEGVKICDSSFAFGCYHGFFTSAISDVGLEVIPSLDEACNGSTECQHGIGHGAMEYMGSDIVNALKACELTDQPDPLAGCTSGVFMEYNVPFVVDGDENRVEPRILNKENPYEPCTDIPDRFKSSCYHELGQWWIQVYEKDYYKIGSLCSDIGNELYRKSCFSGMGNTIPSSADWDVNLTIKTCEEVPTKEGMVYCKIRASWAFLDSPDQKYDGILVCEGLEEEYKKHCFKVN